MGERTISEIIGWGVPTLPSGYAVRPRPTVDDLLAWLADRGYVVTIERAIDHAQAVPVILRRHRGADISYAALYPTALESLEAAVRAVDQSSLASAPPHEVEAHRDISRRGATSPTSPSL